MRSSIPRGWARMTMEQQSAVCRASYGGELPDGLVMRDGRLWTWDQIRREEERVMTKVDALPRDRRMMIKHRGT